MAAPVGLSGSVPEPRHPEATDPEPAAALPVPAQPVAAEPEAADAKGAEPPDAGSVEHADVESPVAVSQPDSGPEPADARSADAGPADAEPADAGPAERAGAPRRIRRLAVVAMVLGVIALAGAAVAVLAVVTHGFRPKTIVKYRPAAVFSLRPGDCINSAPNGLSVTVLSCATPHDAEVFAAFSLAGSSWPGSAVVQQEAGSGCGSRLAGYLNPAFAEAGFAQEYVYPDQAAWQAGFRTVICEVRASSGQLTGSVRQGA